MCAPRDNITFKDFAALFLAAKCIGVCCSPTVRTLRSAENKEPPCFQNIKGDEQVKNVTLVATIGRHAKYQGTRASKKYIGGYH